MRLEGKDKLELKPLNKAQIRMLQIMCKGREGGGALYKAIKDNPVYLTIFLFPSPIPKNPIIAAGYLAYCMSGVTAHARQQRERINSSLVSFYRAEDLPKEAYDYLRYCEETGRPSIMYDTFRRDTYGNLQSLNASMKKEREFKRIFKRAAHEFEIASLPEGHLSVTGIPKLHVSDMNGNNHHGVGLEKKYGYALSPRSHPEYHRLSFVQKLKLKLMGGGYQFFGKSMFKHFKRNPWNLAALAILPLSVPATLFGFGGYTAFARTKNAREYRQDFYEGWNADFSDPQNLPMTASFIDFKGKEGAPRVRASRYLRSVRYDFMDQIKKDIFKLTIPFKLKAHFKKTRLDIPSSTSLYEDHGDKTIYIPPVV